jgi:hypothetical protein
VCYILQASDFISIRGNSRSGITSDLSTDKKKLPFKDKFRGQVIAVPLHDMKAYDEVEVQINK